MKELREIAKINRINLKSKRRKKQIVTILWFCLNGQSLKKLTVKKLQEIAKTHKINLKSKRRKKQIINIVQPFLERKARIAKMNMICSYFRLIKDGKKRLEISQWFREARAILGYNHLSKFLTSKKIIRKIAQIRKKTNLLLSEVVNKTRYGIFVQSSLASLAAKYLSGKILNIFLEFYGKRVCPGIQNIGLKHK